MPESFKVKNIEPNPFRHIETYPIREDKVEALRESIRSTGFWNNVVARPVDGGAEIAYGHHRLEALRREYGPEEEVELIVRDLSDEQMLKIMARENLEEWGTSAIVEQETVRSVVEAYADGRIELREPPENLPDSQLRFAPSFVPGQRPRPDAEAPYTAKTVAEFVGWIEPSGSPQDKVLYALSALQFIEEGLLSEEDFEGLSTTQAEAVVREARRAKERRESAANVHRQQAEEAEQKAAQAESPDERKRYERQAQKARETEKKLQKEGRKQAKTVGRTVSKKLKSGEIGRREARKTAVQADKADEEAEVIWAEDAAQKVATKINRILDSERDDRAMEIEEIIRLRDMLDDDTLENLAKNLDVVAGRARYYAGRLRGEVSERKQKRLEVGQGAP